MSFRFITSVLTIGALVATLSAAPARANGDELGRVIGAAATLFIIGKIVEAETRKKKHEQATTHHTQKPQAHKPQQHKNYAHKQHQPAPQARAHGQVGSAYFQSREVATPRHGRQHGAQARAPLPNQCLIPVNSASTRYVMGRRCLERNYQSARPLPQNCLITLRGARHDRPVYSVRCLRRQGYQVAGY